jgi:hypothetical protein
MDRSCKAFAGRHAPSPFHQGQRRLLETDDGKYSLFCLSFELGENLQRLFWPEMAYAWANEPMVGSGESAAAFFQLRDRFGRHAFHRLELVEGM